MFQKDMRVSLLLDFYGDLLPEKRRELIDLYYNDDLSLSEIAEIRGITRQGVRDSVKKSETELFSLESKLGLVKRYETLREQLSEICSSVTEIASGLEDSNASSELRCVCERLSGLSI